MIEWRYSQVIFMEKNHVYQRCTRYASAIRSSEMHFPAIRIPEFQKFFFWCSPLGYLTETMNYANSKETESLGENGCRQNCLDKILDLLSMLLFYHFSSSFNMPILLKFSYLIFYIKNCSHKNLICILKYFASCGYMIIWRYFQTLTCYIFINFMVISKLILLKLIVESLPLITYHIILLKASQQLFIWGFIIWTFLTVLLFYHFSYFWDRSIFLR